jgi:hypothetical protein
VLRNNRATPFFEYVKSEVFMAIKVHVREEVTGGISVELRNL